jgi:hypothetical protein
MSCIALGFALPACAGTPQADAASEGLPIGAGPKPDLVWRDLWPELAAEGADVPSGATDAAGGILSWPVRPYSPAIADLLVEAESLYLAEDDDRFRVIRDRIVEDPVGAYWLARFLFVRASYARGRPPVIGADGSAVDPWQRPLGELVAMGSPAVPFVVLDLMRTRDPFGPEVLQRMGPDAVEAWQPLLRIEDARVRREAYGILGEVAGESEERGAVPIAAFRDGIYDADFGVRAASYEALTRAARRAEDPNVVSDLLVTGLRGDPDPFVRRAIAECLAVFRPSRDRVRALVAAWRRFEEENDGKGVAAVRRTLLRTTRTDVGGLAAWQEYADSLPVRGAEPGPLDDDSRRTSL